MAEGDYKDKELLLFQLGPVQEFIAQAETPGDLKAGSELLSELTAAALKKIKWPTPSGEVKGYWNDDVAVFPVVKADELSRIPNRFLVGVPRGEGEKYAEMAVAAARDELKRIAAETRKKISDDRLAAFDSQVEAFLQTSWAVLKNPTGNMGKDYKTIGKLMAMRRNVRAFAAWPEEENGKVKDFLSGKEVALDVVSNRADNKNSGRGAMNLIKKHRAEQLKVPDLGKYIAVIALDGDHMGEKLSDFKSKDEHRTLSCKLAEYAASVTIADEEGILVYAGGDDVLAVVKAEKAFGIAEKLAESFVEKLNEKGERKVTASVGVAIGSAKEPLQDIIQEARLAEGRAKHVYGRDSLAASVLKRSGEILHWGCKWNSPALKIYDKLTASKDRLAGFAYKLAGFLEPYELGRRGKDGKLLADWASLKGVMCAETLHSLMQTEKAKGVLTESDIKAYLDNDKTLTDHPEDFLGLFLCESFINRPRD